MKKNFPILFVAIMVSAQLLAQPASTLVKTDFLKNGVTAVEGIVIDKEWYKDHYLWKASFRTVQPVKPEDVDAVAGVTMVRHMIAYYECTGSNCKKTWSDLTHSEYKGIDLPAPANDTLAKMVRGKMMTEPSELVVSMLSKISFDSVKADEPKIDWVNPKKLQFIAKIYYKEKISTPETGVYESPLLVTLERADIKSPFRFSKATQYFERTIELVRIKINIVSSKTEPPPVISSTPPMAGAWKPGDKVMVEENGKWYPSTVLYVRDKEWYIHNDAFDSKYDMWVGASRIKNK
jgi:hypothetical protein